MPGSAQITSSVAWVSALIGLNDRLPQSLTQISSRILARTGALKPAAISAWDSRSTRWRPLAGRLAQREAVALDQLDHAGLGHLGRRVDDAADHALGPDALPLHVARIDARACGGPRYGPPSPWKYHQGTPLTRHHHGRVRSQQRLHRHRPHPAPDAPSA